MRVMPSIFTRSKVDGDFTYMIQQPAYRTALFLFNDNIEDHRCARRGGGNAAIRTFNRFSKTTPPRSAGIPTGSIHSGGFPQLDALAKQHIDDAFLEVDGLITEHGFDTLVFSADPLNLKLGTSIFVIGEDVREYITQKIYSYESK